MQQILNRAKAQSVPLRLTNLWHLGVSISSTVLISDAVGSLWPSLKWCEVLKLVNTAVVNDAHVGFWGGSAHVWAMALENACGCTSGLHRFVNFCYLIAKIQSRKDRKCMREGCRRRGVKVHKNWRRNSKHIFFNYYEPRFSEWWLTVVSELL